MRSMFAIILVFFAAACNNPFDAPEVVQCERRILSKIPNQDSYVRVGHDSLALKEYWQVGIEYSYADENGNRVQNAWQTCDYPIVDGKADTSRFLNVQGSAE